MLRVVSSVPVIVLVHELCELRTRAMRMDSMRKETNHRQEVELAVSKCNVHNMHLVKTVKKLCSEKVTTRRIHQALLIVFGVDSAPFTAPLASPAVADDLDCCGHAISYKPHSMLLCQALCIGLQGSILQDAAC